MSKDRNKTNRKRKRKTETADTKASKRFKIVKSVMRLEDLSNELIPDILNDITLDLICSKLAWRDLDALYSVSSSWRQAIQNHLIYSARVRTNSRETLVVAFSSKHSFPVDILTISQYSMREKRRSELPPIPHIRTGIPYFCQCVTLEGKIYVLGGLKDLGRSSGSRKVYMLDLAGKRKWKKCASMQERRSKFGAGVKNGKIFVFGGTSRNRPLSGSEVYDPTINAWSSIKHMKSSRFDHQVSLVGREFFLHGGQIVDRPALDPADDGGLDQARHASSVEVYNPHKDEWTSIEGVHPLQKMFIWKGKLHEVTESGVYVADIHNQPWTLLQSHSFAEVGSSHSVKIEPYAALLADEELLIMARWYDGDTLRGSRLLRSRGLGTKTREITWETVKCYHCGDQSLALGSPPFVLTIQL